MLLPTFFILGRPRSGTTLLKTLFDAHPNVKIPPELPVFLMLYRQFRGVSSWNEKELLSFVDHVFKVKSYNLRNIGNFHIDKQQFTESILELKGKTNITELLFKLNGHSLSIFPKNEILVVGDKNPVYSIYTNYLTRIFPESKFICIVRDFRDNFVSLKNLRTVTLEAPVLPLQMVRWRTVTETFISCRQKYPDRFRIIRYEDLVTKPQYEFEELCHFLGIPYTDKVFDFHQKKDDFIRIFRDPRAMEIHKSLMYPVGSQRMGLWKTEMSTSDQAFASRTAGMTGKRLRYVTLDKSPLLKDHLRLFPWQIYNKLLFGLMIAGSKMPFTVNRYVSRNVLRLARIYRKFKITGQDIQEKK